MVKEAAKRLLDKKEITQEEFDILEKNANIIEATAEKAKPALFSNLEKMLMRHGNKTMLGLGLAGGMAFTGSELFHKLSQQHAIKKSFEDLTNKVPALKEYPQDKVQDYFDVVKAFSPRSAANPLVAGALVHKMLEFGGVDHKLIQDISHIESTAPTGFLYEIAKGVPGHLTKNMYSKSNPDFME